MMDKIDSAWRKYCEEGSPDQVDARELFESGYWAGAKHGALWFLDRVKLAEVLDDILQLASPVNDEYYVKLDSETINRVIDVYCDLVLDMSDEEILRQTEGKGCVLDTAKIKRIVVDSVERYRKLQEVEDAS